MQTNTSGKNTQEAIRAAIRQASPFRDYLLTNVAFPMIRTWKYTLQPGSYAAPKVTFTDGQPY